uniref:Uncharacterized protein n=1 Tax=Solanum tuberosum TaxID=4113 RepID=M0ZPW9_SOLTU
MSRECRFGVGFCLIGGTVVAGPTRIKVFNKPLNDLIMHFSTFRAKERPPSDSYSFFTILDAKGSRLFFRIMVNTRFNGVRLVAPINAPIEESAARGRGREIEENVDVDVDVDVEDLGQEGEVQAKTTCVPPLDPVLAQQIMSFLK